MEYLIRDLYRFVVKDGFPIGGMFVRLGRNNEPKLILVPSALYGAVYLSVQEYIDRTRYV